MIGSATVTITRLKEVKSTTRYYKLQSSTLNPPAKPTTSPPSSWTTTEPTYTEGSTNSLYTCDLTTFSDNTWAYSAVSLSSSYEAAKAAYNKAKAAADAAAGANAAATAPTYKIVTNAGTISQDPSGACMPATISCRSYQTVASTSGTTSDSYYAGRLVIDASADGSSWTRVYTATSNSSLATKAMSSIVSAVEGCAYVRVALYKAGGTATQLAQAVLPVVQATGNYLQHGSSGLYVCDSAGDPNTGGALRLASDEIELMVSGQPRNRIVADGYEILDAAGRKVTISMDSAMMVLESLLDRICIKSINGLDVLSTIGDDDDESHAILSVIQATAAHLVTEVITDKNALTITSGALGNLPLSFNASVFKLNGGLPFDTPSSGEQATGKTWTNGKPIFRKVIHVASVPMGSSPYNVAHGISSIEDIVSLTGTADGGICLPLFFPDSTTNGNFAISQSISGSNLRIYCGAQASMTNLVSVLEYTKN